MTFSQSMTRCLASAFFQSRPPGVKMGSFDFACSFVAGKLGRTSANKHRRGSLGYARDRLFDSAP
jgi:hypothetical protein